MENIRLSVIIPAFNAAPYIEETLRSVLAQGIDTMEVIVVDDGSTDATADLVRGLADPRIHLTTQMNAGVCAARNTGLERARGTYITFLDADDAMEPDAMQRKIALLEARGVDWVYGDMIRCDHRLRPTGKIDVATDADVVDTILLGTDVAIPAPCSNLVAHRRCFDGGIRLDPSLSTSADQDLTIQLARAHSHAHIREALHRYRDSPHSMSKSVGLYVRDHTVLFKKADRLGWFRDAAMRRTAYANMYYAFAGSWLKLAHRPLKAIPYALRAFALRPFILARPFRGRTSGPQD